MKLKAGIIGATGYTGVELLRILSSHPQVEITALTSRSQAGKPVAELFPSLRGLVDINFSAPDGGQLNQCDVVFAATPNGIAMTQAEDIVHAGIRFIDLAADFRFRDISRWEKTYGSAHACPELAVKAVYGLSEYNREKIKSARIIGNPGCYPTAVLLGILPLLEQDLPAENVIIADCKSGISGAGRSANIAALQAESAESFKAYGVFSHRHQPEIAENLELISGAKAEIVFTPHLVPMIRGILATIYIRLKNGDQNLRDVFDRRYKNEFFVDVLPPGILPETRWVKGSNGCKISVFQRGETAIIIAVIDNLVKGASGQAVQNMNIMFGLDEKEGLQQAALVP